MFKILSPSPTHHDLFKQVLSSFLLGASESHKPFSAFTILAALTRVGRPVKLVMIALLLSTWSFSLLSSAQVLHPCVFRCRALLPSLFLHLQVINFLFQLFWTQFLHLFCTRVHFADLNLVIYDGVQCMSFNQFLHHKSFFMQRWCQIKLCLNEGLILPGCNWL